MDGYPSAILDGKTYQYVKYINPPAGPHTWSNTQPNIIYGTDNKNGIVKLDVTTNTKTTIKTFSEYTLVSYGNWEGNLSNDDRYIALQCSTSSAMTLVVYDLVNNVVVKTMSMPVWPNNVSMSQSGKYVLVQWDRGGTSNLYGICAYNTSDLSFVRNVSTSGGGHYDYGYDTQGNEVVVGTDIDNSSRAIVMVRIDNGTRITLLSDSKMSWYIHISCRNVNRPGWAYLTEFQDPGTQTTKPNYQKIFAVKLDVNATGNALTETFAHVHHSAYDNYAWEVQGTSNRDGSVALFKSDWMGGQSSSEVDSYVAYVPAVTNVPELNNSNNIYIYPNPANQLLVVSYQLSENSNVKIVVCDLLGKEIMQVINEKQTAGEHQLNINTEQLQGGIYFVRMNVNGEEITQKLMVSRSE